MSIFMDIRDIVVGLVMMLLTWTLAPVVLVIALGLAIRTLWPRKPVRAWDEEGNEVDPVQTSIF